MKIRDLTWQIKLLEFNVVNQDDITKYLSQFQSDIPKGVKGKVYR